MYWASGLGSMFYFSLTHTPTSVCVCERHCRPNYLNPNVGLKIQQATGSSLPRVPTLLAARRYVTFTSLTLFHLDFFTQPTLFNIFNYSFSHFKIYFKIIVIIKLIIFLEFIHTHIKYSDFEKIANALNM